ncbi:MAG: hypothetical protein ACI4R9_01230 [Kiritimatiellia bacterium]
MKANGIFFLALSLVGHQLTGAVIDRVDFGGAEGVRIAKSASGFWRSGPVEATLKVDPARTNYLTVRLDGSDVSHGHLLMLVDGKAMGQMHLGEYDLLDYESCWPRDSDPAKADPEHMGVRTFRTFLLPAQAVKGKTEIKVAIYATGHVWGYGQNFRQFQKASAMDSRRIYGILCHDEPFPNLSRTDVVVTPCDPAADCFHKEVPAVDFERIRREVNAALKDRLNVEKLARRPDDAGFLAEGYWTEGTSVYRSDEVVAAIVAVMDEFARKFAADSASVIDDDSWHGLGPIADGIWRLGEEPLRAALDGEIAGLGSRRVKWADALEASCRQLMTHRRFFANQGQIVDTNAHRVNRALKLCDPTRGPALAVTVEQLREAMGLKPCPNGYVALTQKGLSKEDGYVGSYGESTIWAACAAYDVTVDRATGLGDPELRKLVGKAVLVRSHFRFPGVRRDGSRVMRLENVISWRNDHFPGMPDYLSNGSSLLRPFALTHSKTMLGILKDAWDDGWFQRFAMGQGEKQMSLLDKLFFLKDYPVFEQALKRIEEGKLVVPHLPMRGDDFVWCDSENAVVAAKYGEEVLYVNAYYRARGAINNLARIHFVRPDSEFAATVWCDEEFQPDGDRTEYVHNYFQYGWQGKLYDGYRQPDPDGTDAYSTALGIAWPPQNVRGGMTEPVARRGGRADFYHVNWGPYEVCINDDPAAKSRDYTLPKGSGVYLDVATKERVRPGTTVMIPAHDARVFRKVAK